MNSNANLLFPAIVEQLSDQLLETVVTVRSKGQELQYQDSGVYMNLLTNSEQNAQPRLGIAWNIFCI